MKTFSLLHIPTACRCELEYESELDLLVDLSIYLDINKNTIFINEKTSTFRLSCVISSPNGNHKIDTKLLEVYTRVQVHRHEFMVEEENIV